MSAPALPAIHLVEPNPNGHRLWMLAHILDQLPSGWRWVVHTTAKGLAHPAWQEIVDRQQPQVSAVDMGRVSQAPAPGRLALLQHQIRKARQYDRHLRRYVRAGDRVFIPYVDDVILPLAAWPNFLVGMDLSVLAMRDASHYPDLGIATIGWQERARSWLVERWLRSGRLRRYGSNQQPFCSWARQRWSRAPVFIPDPASPAERRCRKTACAELGIDPDRRWILCFGGLTPRKGIAELLAWRKHPDWPDYLGVVCAGRCDDGIARMLAAEEADDPGLVVRAGFASATDEQRLYAACDLVWIVYRQHLGMSGTVINAGLQERPAAICPQGMLGWYNARLQLGPAIDPDAESAAAIATITTWLDDPERCRRAAGRGRRMFATHAEPAFRRRLWRLLGLVPQP